MSSMYCTSNFRRIALSVIDAYDHNISPLVLTLEAEANLPIIRGGTSLGSGLNFESSAELFLRLASLFSLRIR